MSISALLVTAFIDAIGPEPRTVSCIFPATSPGDSPISVAVEARPSLMDASGRFRVRLHLSDEKEFGGLAQAIDRTDDRDVLIRARAAHDLVYTIGLRDDGMAALNMLRVLPETSEGRTETREGACRGFMAVLNSWLRS